MMSAVKQSKKTQGIQVIYQSPDYTDTCISLLEFAHLLADRVPEFLSP